MVDSIHKLDVYDFIFLTILVSLLLLNYLILSPLKQLPSPIYGGDYYNHLGSMEHIYQGGSLFESGQLLNEIQWVPWLYHICVVVFAKITSIVVWKSVVYFSLVLLAISCFAFYIFFSRFFSSKIYGLLAVIWQGANFPLFKYSPFAYYVITPLFLFSMYFFLKKDDLETGVIVGIMYGLVGLSNTYSFIVMSFFMFVFFLYYVVFINSKIEKGKIKIKLDHALHNFKKYIFIFAIGVSIALLWWYAPIFIYHAKTPNDLQIYGFQKTETLGDMLNWILTGLQNSFLNFSSPFRIIYSFFGFCSLILLFFLKNKRTEEAFILLIFFGSLIGLLSHFITMPLFHTHMVPTGLWGTGMITCSLLLFLYFIKFLTKKINNKKIEQGFLVIIFFLLIFNLYSHINYFTEDKWYSVGKTELPTYLLDMAEWVKQNTNLHDVFLTDNEDGFILNALTGRKLITYRRTHSPVYADMNQRMLDASIILYGNNDSIRKKLIEKYKVKYLFWHYRWLQNEFTFNNKGELVNIFDPLMFDYTKEREKIIVENNISYRRINWYLDPAWRETYPKRDVLVVFPSEWNITHPWNKKLDKFLHLEKSFVYDNKTLIRIYKIY